jgi:hypothetical protein
LYPVSCGQIQQHTMTDCINGSNLSKNENKQIKALPPYIIQSLLVSPNKPKHVADDRRPKNAMFAFVFSNRSTSRLRDFSMYNSQRPMEASGTENEVVD